MSTIPHYLRLKPQGESAEAKEREYLIESKDDTQVKFVQTTNVNKFTRIFDECSQIDLYKGVLEELTQELFQDKDSVLFTLGPSNSGKSYSIYGNESNPGLTIYSLNDIFNKIESNLADFRYFKKHFGENFIVGSSASKEKTGEYGLSLSVFEIYNDRIRDLTLDPSKTQNQSLDIVTDNKDGKIKPNKLRQIFVTNLKEAKLVLHKSIKRRAVSPTNINEQSSRSHLFIYFNIHKVVGRLIKTSRLTIADLAGSERTKTAKTVGKEFKEGNYTNTSLTELGRILALMKSKRFDRSILRTSKLTRLLLTDLYGNLNQNRIKILLTLDPFSSISNIIHAVRYIQPVSKVTINSERNSLETITTEFPYQVSQLNEEVKVLREMNAKLEDEKSESEAKLLEFEAEIRREISEEFETKIKEIEVLHAGETNSLKESHENILNERLNLLSEDYESKLESKSAEFDLTKKNYEEKITAITEGTNITSEINQGLKKETDSLKLEREDLSNKYNSIKCEVDTLKRINEEIKQSVKHFEKKYLKKSKKVEELEEEVKILQEQIVSLKSSKKRKSDASLVYTEDGVKKNKTEETLPEFDDKENDFAVPFSPAMRMGKSSPSKHFKFSDEGFGISPVKKLNFEIASPIKKNPLMELNQDTSVTSPKKSPKKSSSSKSPSKSPKKKKLLARNIIDHDNLFEDE
ncbi:hypothetical protein WICMUC_001195 [Wickerhamomyces mucosus]|uniref:Kinesin motor domain-containing protein n=1 Tax=Wickerhamomyces mucosus TaxID=1378264 RepID=A0A9P8PXS6_9ASCO|nr:hypothetical protein WICMUC_001195 [Wickerhamomyces mucosus]